MCPLYERELLSHMEASTSRAQQHRGVVGAAGRQQVEVPVAVDVPLPHPPRAP